MSGNERTERELLAEALADEAVDALALEGRERLMLAALLEIDLLVDPALSGVLETELLQRKHLGPSGTVEKPGASAAELARTAEKK